MADNEESPLLLDDDAVPSYPRKRHKVGGKISKNNVVGLKDVNYGCNSNLAENITRNDAANIDCDLTADNIVSVFVVAFDTKAGNIIEWCIPHELELSGIEFKAMVSGFHTLLNDFVYFRKGNLYGLACFENMRVESEIERGARMKSVGILSTSYKVLYRHMQFLEKQVRHQLETPCQYRQLEAFWEDKKGTLPYSTVDSQFTRFSSASTSNSEIVPEMKITHPAGCFYQFIQFFAEQIFVLWKFALLGKRILFFSPPPIGVVCYRVYCACCLANHDLHNQFPEKKLQPHFYVNVADIDTLESEVSYVACTTEKIFESKTSIYDVYIDNQVVKTSSETLKELLKPNSADKSKLQLLNAKRSDYMTAGSNCEEEIDMEDSVTMFFVEQNNRIFQTLLDVSTSDDRTITAEHMKDMGLDPKADRTFIMELLETYGIDVMLFVDNPCCPI